jgi:potassium efflux system protein
MRWCNVIMVWTTFWLVFFLHSPGMLVAQAFQSAPTVTAASDTPRTHPDLADLIPLEAALPGRFATLKQRLGTLVDLTDIEKHLATMAVSLEAYSRQFQHLQAATGSGYYQLTGLKTAIRREGEALAKVSATLTETLRQLGAWRVTWLTEKQQWNAWQSSGRHDALFDDVQQTFVTAHHTIDAALELLQQQIKLVLAAQQQARDLQVRHDVLATDVDGVIATMWDDAWRHVTPPMLSSRYLAQFDSRLWYDVRNGLEDVAWPDRQFMAQQGWAMLLQGVISLVVILALVRHRRQLSQTEHWRFVATRPVAAGFFVGGMTALAFYEWSSIMFAVAYTVLIGIAFVRLLGGLLGAGWKKQLVVVLLTLLITTRLLEALNVPQPLFRLYVLLAALCGLVGCLRWTAQSGRDGEGWLYRWALRLGVCLFGVILLAELAGQAKQAEYLLVSSLRSLFVVLAFGLLRYLVHAGLEGVMGIVSPRSLALLRGDTAIVVQRLALLADALIAVVVVAGLLASWGLYDDPMVALGGVLAIGFSVWGRRVNVGHIVAAVVVLFGAFLVSGLLQRLLVQHILAKRQMETGVQLAIARLVHYALVFAGMMVALLTLGFNPTHLTILLSALGVGIGFGLQAIVNNFLCGLILLFERPIRVGDTIELGGQWARIQKIGLRATTVQTFDQADIILPNSDLINHQVTNWTLANRHARILIPVGVAYGSDVPLVMHTLMACAAANALVMDTPEPLVFFRQFGASSLDFELRVWIWNVDNRFRVISELHQEIERRFREAGIEIAFPQRDLHIRSVDTPAAARLPLPLRPEP